MRRSYLGWTVAVAALLTTAGTSWGQVRVGFSGNIRPGFQVPPALDLSQAAFNAAVFRPAGPVSPLAMGFNPFPPSVTGGPVIRPFPAAPTITSTPAFNGFGHMYSSNPWVGSPGWGGWPDYYSWLGAGYGNSFSASLSGLADLTAAQGQYLNDWQRARLVNQQVEQAKLETRRQMASLYRQERSLQPSLEEMREQEREREVRRARRDPPLTEILSAKSLNDLLKNSMTLQSRGIEGDKVVLNPELLQKVNLTSGRGGNVGLLKNEGRLQWPLALQDSLFEKDREQIDRLAAEAVKKAQFNNTVDPATLNELGKRVEGLNRSLEANLGNISTPRYIEASRYLGLLDDALTALEDPNVANFFTQKWAAKGQTVSALVKYMSDNGLRFAPAVPGDEAAYQALQSAMAAYDSSLIRSSVSTTPRPEK